MLRVLVGYVSNHDGRALLILILQYVLNVELGLRGRICAVAAALRRGLLRPRTATTGVI